VLIELAGKVATAANTGDIAAAASTASRPVRFEVRRLLVQQLLDPAQRAAQGLRVGAGAAQRQRGLELGNDGIRYGLQRFGCISLRSTVVPVPSTAHPRLKSPVLKRMRSTTLQ
jgi:hypothetical protein